MRLTKITFITAFLILGVFTFFSTVQTAPKTSEGGWSENESQIQDKELFAQNCARCHGADGSGQTTLGKKLNVPNISDAKWQKRHNDKKITAKITKGDGKMPAFGEKLSAQEIKTLVSYVRSLKNND